MTATRRAGPFLAFLPLAVVLLWTASPLAGQNPGVIRGTVRSSERNTPIHGAQVSIEGLRVGTITNQDGRYVLLNVPPGTHTLNVTNIGYATERRENVAVGSGQPVIADFQLRTVVLHLSEIVVTGVSEATSVARLPFTVSVVDREAMPVAPRTAEAAIQGKVAGASVMQAPQPGEAANIVLRTPTSINRENEPLIVVDGVILTENSVDISSLDIDQVEVIKGAAAASLYGSRAAAGVIQIRTTRGSSLPEGRTRFTLRTEYGANDIPHPIKWAQHHPYQMNDSGEFLNAQGEPVPRHQAATTQFAFQDQAFPGQIYDHVESLFNTAGYVTQHASLGYNSGNTSWLASGSFHRSEGVTRELDGYKRGDFRVNLDHRLANDLSFSGSLFYARSEQDDPGFAAFFDFVQIAPDVNLLQPDPDGTPYHFQPDEGGIRPNPLYRFANETHTDKRQRALASLDLRYNPLSWLAFNVNGSYDRSDRDNEDYVPKGSKTANFPDGDPGSLSRFNGLTNGLNASAAVIASRDFGPIRTRSTLRALIEREDNETATAEGDVFSVGGVPDLDALLSTRISSFRSNIRSTGYFLNTDADYADKYIVSTLLRRDGSSLFGSEERWHWYSRLSGAYRMAAEPWWPLPWVNEFKLRYSRGTAGGRPNFQDRFEVFTVQEGGGLELNTLGNQFLKPEHSTEQEFGVDVVALERVSLQLTYAKQKTVDQLVQVPLPRIYGYGTRWENAGTLKGHTYEGTLEARLISNDNLRWSVNLIADRSRNKIVEYNRPCHTDDFGFRCAGETLGMLFGQKFLSSADELHPAAAAVRDEFQVNDDGLLVWVGAGNTYKDGVAKELWGTSTTIGGVRYLWGHAILLRDSAGGVRRVKIGDSNADLNWGLGSSVQWKGFNVYALLGGQIGGDIYNDTKQRMYQWWRHRDEDQVGKPDELKKPISYYSGTLYSGAINSSWFVEDASFLKLREVSVRYGVNATQFAPLARMGIERAVLSLIGRNLAIWTDYSGYDPEIIDDADGGAIAERVDSFTFPSYRTITAGIEIVF